MSMPKITREVIKSATVTLLLVMSPTIIVCTFLLVYKYILLPAH
ncbi:hypothetical protein ES705_31914 [subsurface metagenome]